MPGVLAWIIAVERHSPEGGSPLDFKVPISRRALECAEWLRGRPGLRLLLNISAAPTSEELKRIDALRPAALNSEQAHRADAASLHHSLQLVKTAPVADLLLLVWIGHGVMRDRQRFLIHQDARDPSNLRSWEVDSLLQNLRTAPGPELQIGVFDTCAQHIDAAPGSELLGGSGKAQRRQHFYFASTAGAFATVNPNESTLASLALEALQAHEWPPQPGPFGETLQAVMSRLSSLPVAWEWTQGSGDAWSSRDTDAELDARIAQAARQSEIGEACFRHLWRELTPPQRASDLAKAIRVGTVDRFVDELEAEWPNTAEALRHAWARVQRITPWVKPLAALGLVLPQWMELAGRLSDYDGRTAPPFTELRQLLLWAVDMEGDDGSGVGRGEAALLRLIVMAMREAERLVIASRPACGRVRQQLEADGAFAPLLAQLEASMPVQRGPLVLLVELDLPANSRTPVIARHWLLRDHTLGPGLKLRLKGAVGDQLNTLIHHVMAAHLGTLRVELLAPLELLVGRREWVSYRYDDTDDDGIGLDTLVPICWRWRDRMKGKDPRWQAPLWQRDAPSVRERVSRSASLSCRFDDEQAGAAADVLGLTWPPPGPAETGGRRGQFVQALVRGHPYMLWPTSVQADTRELKKQVKTWLAEQTLLQLPERYRDARSNGLLPHVVLFFDEPERNPYAGTRSRLRAVASSQR